MRVVADEAEVARARILALAPEGFEEVVLEDGVELAVYTDAGGEEQVRSAFGSADATLVASGWEDAWRKFHRGACVGGLWIGPPWEQAPAEVPAVVVEPGRAFGTGAHPTTRACVELLARAPRGSLLDAGCGSGVLALAGARLGFGPVVAVDLDPAAVEATQANATGNGIDLEVRRLDALRDTLPPADVLVANIDLDAVNALLGRWRGTAAITSGYLAGERPSADGWSSAERVELDGWAADRLVRAATV